MGDLDGNRIKDFHNQLLQLESEPITAANKEVQDGNGNTTALGLSTIEVLAAALKITNVTESPTETRFLVHDSSDKSVNFRSVSTEVLAGNYDSGWIDFPSYNTSTNPYGMYPYTNQTFPQFRVINRMVFFKGAYKIGLDSGGGTLVTNWETVRTTQANTVATEANTANGITLNVGTSNFITTPPLFDTLTFDTIDAADLKIMITRETFLADNGGVLQATRGVRYKGASSLVAQADTSLRVNDFSSAGESPQYSSGFNSKHFNLRRIIAIHDQGDRLYDYSSYKNAFNAAGAVDLATPAAASVDYHYVTFDGSDVSTWGGINVNLNGHFALIGTNFSIAEIQSAIETQFPS